jgi:MSHA biogenesis protein MshJ
MRRLWARYAERIDAMSARERVFIFAAIAVAVVMLLYTSLLDAEIKKQRRLSSAMAQRQAETRSLEAQIAKVVTGRARDPDAARRQRLAEVRAQLADTERQIGAEERKFTAPQQMKRVVEEMLAKNRAVQLVGMRTLATTSVAEARAPAGAKPAATKPATPGERLIYRHGIELTVSGPYLELLRYLGQLEFLPNQLYWGGLELDASRYPNHTLKIIVYTLSLDPAWLNV